MITSDHSNSWPNVVHRAILCELHGYIDHTIIDQVVIYSTSKFDFAITIDDDGTVSASYAIQKEEPFRFHRFICIVAEGDLVNLHILKLFIQDIQTEEAWKN